MNEPDKLTSAEYKTIIERCFTAFNEKDRETMEGLLSNTFTFTSQYDNAIDRATYFERCWPNTDRIRQHEIERIFVKGNEAFVTYRAITFEGKEFRNTEFFTFEGTQISSVNVYFGATSDRGIFVINQK
jgi:ketosteroid isomerase-like protein